MRFPLKGEPADILCTHAGMIEANYDLGLYLSRNDRTVTVHETPGEQMTRMFRSVIAKSKELQQANVEPGCTEWNEVLNQLVSVKGNDSNNLWPNPEWITLMERLLRFQYFTTGEIWSAGFLKRQMLEFHGAVSSI